MVTFVIRLGVLLGICTAAGIAHGLYRKEPPLVPDVQRLKQAEAEHDSWKMQTAIDVDAFREHYEMGNLVIDARPADLFEAGHLDAPMITNIPPEDSVSHIERVMPYMGSPIVLYCSSLTCDDAEIVYKLLVDYGFPPETLYVYHEGWEGIRAAGLPEIEGPDLFAEMMGDPYGAGGFDEDPYLEDPDGDGMGDEDWDGSGSGEGG